MPTIETFWRDHNLDIWENHNDDIWLDSEVPVYLESEYSSLSFLITDVNKKIQLTSKFSNISSVATLLVKIEKGDIWLDDSNDFWLDHNNDFWLDTSPFIYFSSNFDSSSDSQFQLSKFVNCDVNVGNIYNNIEFNLNISRTLTSENNSNSNIELIITNKNQFDVLISGNSNYISEISKNNKLSFNSNALSEIQSILNVIKNLDIDLDSNSNFYNFIHIERLLETNIDSNSDVSLTYILTKILELSSELNSNSSVNLFFEKTINSLIDIDSLSNITLDISSKKELSSIISAISDVIATTSASIQFSSQFINSSSINFISQIKCQLENLFTATPNIENEIDKLASNNILINPITNVSTNIFITDNLTFSLRANASSAYSSELTNNIQPNILIEPICIVDVKNIEKTHEIEIPIGSLCSVELMPEITYKHNLTTNINSISDVTTIISNSKSLEFDINQNAFINLIDFNTIFQTTFEALSNGTFTTDTIDVSVLLTPNITAIIDISTEIIYKNFYIISVNSNSIVDLEIQNYKSVFNNIGSISNIENDISKKSLTDISFSNVSLFNTDLVKNTNNVIFINANHSIHFDGFERDIEIQTDFEAITDMNSEMTMLNKSALFEVEDPEIKSLTVNRIIESQTGEYKIKSKTKKYKIFKY